jgi:phage terminase small subunit
MAETELMAAPKKTGERSPKNKERKDIVGHKTVALRCTLEFAAWLEESAKQDDRTVASFLERAAKHYAAAIGVKSSAPERV